jgi:hypothetical protein
VVMVCGCLRRLRMLGSIHRARPSGGEPLVKGYGYYPVS